LDAAQGGGVSLLLGHIVDVLGGSLEGGANDTAIHRIAPLEFAGPGDISFLSHPRYQQQLAASQAACVIVAPAMRDACLGAWRMHRGGQPLRVFRTGHAALEAAAHACA
jgi:UDP-3-O-[3-hydroxymyristoyl] glucosamine N-acyltransferase